MESFYLRLECAAPTATQEQLEHDFDLVADALYELDRIYDQDLSVDLSARTLTFSMAVDADSQVDALAAAMSAARTALHAAGGGTPGWEDHYKMARQTIDAESNEAVDA